MRQGHRGGGAGRRLVVLTGLALALSTCSAAYASVERSTSADCPNAPARIACVDLSHQAVWVQSHGRTTWGPVHIRSGAPATPTPVGLWHIYRRLQQHRSTINGEPMPYSQYFDGAVALHGTFKPLTSPPGSLGCVTMSVSDAASLWQVTKIGDPVYVFGHRPRR
jgi:lipoprotein-anchoring transpeptidase ErfK/SrfK